MNHSKIEADELALKQWKKTNLNPVIDNPWKSWQFAESKLVEVYHVGEGRQIVDHGSYLRIDDPSARGRRGHDPELVKQAVYLGLSKFGSNFSFTGTEEFRKMAENIKAEIFAENPSLKQLGPGQLRLNRDLAPSAGIEIEKGPRVDISFKGSPEIPPSPRPPQQPSMATKFGNFVKETTERVKDAFKRESSAREAGEQTTGPRTEQTTGPRTEQTTGPRIKQRQSNVPSTPDIPPDMAEEDGPPAWVLQDRATRSGELNAADNAVQPKPSKPEPKPEHAPEPSKPEPKPEHAPEPSKPEPKPEHAPEPSKPEPKPEHAPEPSKPEPKPEHAPEPSKPEPKPEHAPKHATGPSRSDAKPAHATGPKPEPMTKQPKKTEQKKTQTRKTAQSKTKEQKRARGQGRGM